MAFSPRCESIEGIPKLHGLHYRRFVKNYRILVRPLTELLKKDGFQWTEEAEKSFLDLKMAMTQLPILVV